MPSTGTNDILKLDQFEVGVPIKPHSVGGTPAVSAEFPVLELEKSIRGYLRDFLGTEVTVSLEAKEWVGDSLKLSYLAYQDGNAIARLHAKSQRLELGGPSNVSEGRAVGKIVAMLLLWVTLEVEVLPRQLDYYCVSFDSPNPSREEIVARFESSLGDWLLMRGFIREFADLATREVKFDAEDVVIDFASGTKRFRVTSAKWRINGGHMDAHIFLYQV